MAEEEQNSDMDVAEGNEGPTDMSANLPQKRYYRQRAHSNPICDHIFDFPLNPSKMDWTKYYPDFEGKQVEFLDVGCGYGGLMMTLSPLFPNTLMLGMEIRTKVSQYVMDKVSALRKLNPGQYNNLACIRGNAMKYLPNFFKKGQLQKMFFLYPDPHFKKSKHKWRIISDTLLSEYAYIMAEGGLIYTVTDVEDLHQWMVKHISSHPLFEIVGDKELESDLVVKNFYDSSEEGKKVTRNHGDKFSKVFRRVSCKNEPPANVCVPVFFSFF